MLTKFTNGYYSLLGLKIVNPKRYWTCLTLLIAVQSYFICKACQVK